ncbi:WSC domain-containing protein [Corynascus novoguineensis]|uniref:WSC domain-containing protein n=1 Tax=Corynascus novoguineensis TaxID=1126955 RepID=A0AAN7CYX6_9PEZI|nr:WSC domain-containing protein [Corynascus novoguineensis]
MPAMKASIFPFLAVLAARHVIASEHPLLQWDPATAKDCVEWYNNGQGESCEDVRNLFRINPEQFHKWNPSSYCIVTQERLDNDPPPPMTTSSTTELITTTTSSSTLAPSPTAWAERGCYVEDPELPLLDQNMSGAGGDSSLTIGKCKNICYRKAYPFAGVQEGNQCWCGTYIGGEWAENQSDCNIPCTGDKKMFCGGNGLLNIFQALENSVTLPATVSSTPTSPGTAPGTAMSTSTASSGARRNMIMFF